MNYNNKWIVLKELGEGGQGKVFQVRKFSELGNDEKIKKELRTSIKGITSASSEQISKSYEHIKRILAQFMDDENIRNHGALKILHKPEDARDYKNSMIRIKREIRAMSESNHANLLKIIDYDPDSEWFVSEYHPKGTLKENRKKYIGDVILSLKSIRSLVSGVAELHKNGFTHRDIKPQNIFLDKNDNLILGDFGLVFFEDEEMTRISNEFSNVGSRDWMPPWAVG